MTTTAAPAHGAHLLQNYRRAPVTFVRGEGCELIDEAGKRYLDLVAGIAVCALGHSHPRIAAAVSRQASTLVHCSNLYAHEPAGRLADVLATRSGFGRVFFCNSGAEANEAAIKFARKAAFRKGEARRRTVLTCTGSFHGRTLATVTATANAKYQEGFDPLPGGFRTTPFNDVAALETAIDETVAAFLIEPVQGESGIWVASDEYLQRARELCHERGALLIFDEIQCGLGRIGCTFAFEHFGVRPDAITIAKALANGLPIGALLIDEHHANALQPGDHGTTFGGSPVPCAAALEHFTVRDELKLDQHVQRAGGILREGLAALAAQFPDVYGEVRGLGLMRGLQVREPFTAEAIAVAARERYLLVNAAGSNTLRIVPPLIISDAQLATALERLAGATKSVR